MSTSPAVVPGFGLSIAEQEAAKVKCPKCDSKKVTQVPGRVHVVTSKKS